MNKVIKRHLISAGLTFGGVFIVTFCGLVSVETFKFSTVALQTVVISAIIAGARAALKVIWEIGTYLITQGKK